MQTKWIASSYNPESISKLKVKQGIFSSYHQESQNNKSARAYHLPDHKRLKERNKPNASFDIINKTNTHINSENEIYTSILETQTPSLNSDQLNIQHNVMISQPLAEKHGNEFHGRESKSQPHSHGMQYSHNNQQNKIADDNSIKIQQQGSYTKISQNNQMVQRNNNIRSPMGYAAKKKALGNTPSTSNKKLVPQYVNEDNTNEPVHPKVTRSQSTFVLRGPNESDSQNAQGIPSSESFFVQEQDVERLKRENQELFKNVNKLTNELQNEKKRCAVLEAEVENFKNDLVKEREKYKEELCKISQQIKKLRNIQNIYVTEKKNSEKLENQLNQKEKTLNDTSYLLCESLKAMLNVLETVLLKGDIALEKSLKANDFTPEAMYRLFSDIRRQILPRIEEAETFNLSFEWKGRDYKDIIANSKELLKMKKNSSSRALNPPKDFEAGQGVSQNINRSPSPIPINHEMTSKSDSMSDSTNAVHSPKFAKHENPLITNSINHVVKKIPDPNNLNVKNLPKSIQNLPIQTQKSDDYIPLQHRVSLNDMRIEEIARNIEGINLQNKISEDINEENLTKKRASSVSKQWDADPNLGENFLVGSLGSTIVPRTNNCSGFIETFDNFLGENLTLKNSCEDRKTNADGSENNNKTYDLPIATSGLGMLSQGKSINELEAARNKILKRKQSIEARRASAINEQNYFLDQPGIAENSEESMTSFQKTLEEDSLQHHHVNKETPQEQRVEKPQNVLNPFINKSPYSLTQQNNIPNMKNNEPQGRLARSSSTLAFAPSQEQRNNQQNQQLKRENSHRSLTEEGRRESSAQNQEEQQPEPNRTAKSQGEQFAYAKFDYNAQKENDLSFSKGDKIRILRKTETGWWIGLSNNKIGYFPCNFVEVIEQ